MILSEVSRRREIEVNVGGMRSKAPMGNNALAEVCPVYRPIWMRL